MWLMRSLLNKIFTATGVDHHCKVMHRKAKQFQRNNVSLIWSTQHRQYWLKISTSSVTWYAWCWLNGSGGGLGILGSWVQIPLRCWINTRWGWLCLSSFWGWQKSASLLVSCGGVATHPGLCRIGKETALAAPTLCTEYGPDGWILHSWAD